VRWGPDSTQQAGSRAGEGDETLERGAVSKDAVNISLVAEKIAKGKSFEPDGCGKAVRFGWNAFFDSPVRLPNAVRDFQMPAGAI
jgi:hypothetical protein